MTISMTDDKRLALANKLSTFLKSLSQPLIKWARLTGRANWGINIFPLGRWASQSSWDKTAGKPIRNAQEQSNSMTRSDQKWLSNALSKWDGKQLLDSAEATLFCDARPTGLGIWIPNAKKGYTLQLPPPSQDIYWAELPAGIHAIMIAHDSKAKRIVIFTDSHNIVDLFNSHRNSNLVRILFRKVIDLMLINGLDAKVKHIAGEQNIIADSLSRNNLNLMKSKLRSLEIIELTSIPTELDRGIKKSHQEV